VTPSTATNKTLDAPHSNLAPLENFRVGSAELEPPSAGSVAVRPGKLPWRMKALLVPGLTLLLALAGCATTPTSRIQRPPGAVPPEAMITQRGILTVLGRQYTLNGYLALSAAGGKRLVVTETFGGVLADVLIPSDGSVHVMRSSRAFKPKWIRRYLAADVECLFGNSATADCPGRALSPTHFLIERRWYRLDLQIVEIKPGPQPASLFDTSKAEKP